MSEPLQHIDVEVDWLTTSHVRRALPASKLTLPLTRLPPPERPRGAVLLLHGASAASGTFLLPTSGGLARYLRALGFDVWLLDWRGGKRIAEKHGDVCYRDAFTMDAAAQNDIPGALAKIRGTLATERKAGLPLHVVAHCFGAGCLAMSIGSGALAEHDVTHVVLLTLGLFYVAPWDGFIKADDFVLERIIATAPGCTAIHPGCHVKPPLGPGAREEADDPTVWPREMEESFAAWPRQLLPTCDVPLCHRVSFMFGQPYLEDNLAPGIHTPEVLGEQFGSMPLALYVHAGQNVRRGYAAPHDATLHPATPDAPRIDHYLNRAAFERHDVTLITGTENTIWHCDSIHRMHDWLMSGRARRSTKHVLRGYAHQDLLWGRNADVDVYPLIASGLGIADTDARGVAEQRRRR